MLIVVSGWLSVIGIEADVIEADTSFELKGYQSS